MSYFKPPYSFYDPTDKECFSYETVVKRWPVIITGVLDDIYRKDHELATNPTVTSEAQIEEGKSIIEKISKLKYEMGRDRPLPKIEEDGEADVAIYNAELETLETEHKNTWFTAPWLYAECYLYRLIRSWLAQTKHWKDYDPFRGQKESTFKSSSAAVFKLSSMMNELEVEKSEQQAQGRDFFGDTERLRVLFQEMLQMCLWGNATDLSLLTNLTHADIQALQSVGKNAQEERKEFILKDESAAVWAQLSSLKEARIDIVLDNAGFELYTDLVFADFLVTYTSYVSRVVFHPKSIPWFVSDVTPPDFKSTFTSLLSPTHFGPLEDGAVGSEQSSEHLASMVKRWNEHLASGAFALSVPSDAPVGLDNAQINFWTQPFPYWDMKLRAPELFENLKESGLAVFKGDLNYRKLTGDIRWPVDTPFSTALGPLAGSYPILSLRTNKADVVVGVPKDVGDKLDASGEKWRVNGKYALISFEPKVSG